MPSLNVFRFEGKEQKWLKMPGHPLPRPYQGTGSREETVPTEQGGHVLCCAACRLKITDFECLLEMDGRHEHTFVNPSGITFRIGCFSSAPGCRAEGSPTREFTWFPGFDWSIALCRNCGIHLGWYYDAQDADGFYGLVLARLIWNPSG